MDFSAFSSEIFHMLSERLPEAVICDCSPETAVHAGGWYYPSARERSAWLFDLKGAYHQYLSGASVCDIADAMEYDFLMHQWDLLAASLPDGLLSFPAPEWALRLKDGGGGPERGSSLSLFWDRYILEPCCRFLAADSLSSLSFRPLTQESLARLETDEDGFWERFWREIVLQDPPVLLPPSSDAGSPPGKSPVPGGEDYRILTGTRGLYGAAVIFYPGLLGGLHRQYGDFRLLITSPHEVLLYPRGNASAADETFIRLRAERETADSDGAAFLPGLYQYTVDAGLTPCQI